MKRIPVLAGNWKMNKTPAEASELARLFAKSLGTVTEAEVVLCPPYVALLAVQAAIQGTRIGLGAQNLHWEKSGAFTGEISAGMLAGWCSHVIIGHSERRQHFGETDETVNKKVIAAQKHGLIPIVCVGETLAENEAGRTAEVVRRQTLEGLKGVDAGFASQIVVAYEPVWAIGTGRASSAENAENVHRNVVRAALKDLFGSETAEAIRILYGGSVTAANAAEFFSQADIDGALVGGASLKSDEFIAIARAAAS